ncbi:hypothetical protein H6504_04935 [Candidatus Woesearchaeota archaeon]|nr:hypothetical protein [Candidatus Woesearchaeota archaeon]
MRDKHHYTGSAVVLLLSFIIAYAVYAMMEGLVGGPQEAEIRGVIAFSIGIFINTSFLVYNYPRLTHPDTRLNASTQIMFGFILIVASLVMLILIGFFNMDFLLVMIWGSGLVLALIYVSIDRFDVYIEDSLGGIEYEKAEKKILAEEKATKKKPSAKKKK